MIQHILIVGCGLIGSSLLRVISQKKICKKIFVYEKSFKLAMGNKGYWNTNYSPYYFTTLSRLSIG